MENKIRVEPSSVLFKEGDLALNLYIVKSGEVACLKSYNDRLIPVFVAREGDIIGENAILNNTPNAYSAISLKPSELISIPAENFLTIMKEAPEWLSDLSTTMVKRFEATASLVAENRVIHSSILSEEDFTSAMEVEFKKLLN